MTEAYPPSMQKCLVFTGEVEDLVFAKTASGIVQWCPERVVGQLRFAGNNLDLGVPDLSLVQAVEAGAKDFIIGVAPVGGAVSERWVAVLCEAASLGMNIISGLHSRLEDIPGLTTVAKKSGSHLMNVRVPPPNIPVGNGQKRSGKRVLMVGTDCAVGKKYTALALSKSLQQLGVAATFRATGQTGIMITGSGIPIDSVVSDFVSGAAELVSPANQAEHWDVIEGQGSLFNASYAGVSLGLLHGSQPDAIVVCHDAARHAIISCPNHPLPTIADCIDLNVRCAQLTNPAVRCVGVSVNTSSLSASSRQQYLEQLSKELSLPCVDSVIDGCDAIASQLLEACDTGELTNA